VANTPADINPASINVTESELRACPVAVAATMVGGWSAEAADGATMKGGGDDEIGSGGFVTSARRPAPTLGWGLGAWASVVTLSASGTGEEDGSDGVTAAFGAANATGAGGAVERTSAVTGAGSGERTSASGRPEGRPELAGASASGR
jgi:hypothetical protein